VRIRVLDGGFLLRALAADEQESQEDDAHTASYTLCRSLFEGGDAGDVFADDQRVDVVGALVGEHRFQIAHMTSRLVLYGDAVGAEEVARVAGDVAGHADVVALGERDVL